MERKHIFLIAGSLLVLTAIGIGIYLLTQKPGDDNPEEKKKDNPGSENNDPKKPDLPVSSPGTGNNINSIQNGQVVPIFNEEKELNNPIAQLKDRQLYPKREWQGGWGYTNVRSSAEVNTESAWYDPFDNLLTTIGAGTPIGKVITSTTGVFNSYPYKWFKVKLNKKVGFWGTTDEGYVRADTVTFVPYTKT